MPTASIEDITTATAGHTAPGRFLDLVSEHPTAPALRSMRGGEPGAWTMWTYQGYAERVSEAAAGLRSLGLEAGERVMLMMGNRPDFHWLDLAAQFVRLTPVSIYNSSSADEMQFVVDHTEARVAIVEDARFLHTLMSIKDRLPLLEKVFVLDAPFDALPDGVYPALDLFGHGHLDLVALAQEVDPTDIATLIYTSGTTGPPKGVMISQSNVVYTVEQLRQCIDLQEPLGQRVVSYLPMAHIAERMTSHYQAMILGFDVHCCPDLSLLSPYLREVRPDVLFGVPRVWEKLRSAVLAALAASPERQLIFDQAISEALVIKAAERVGTTTDHQRARWQQLDAMVFTTVRTMLGLDKLDVAITGAAPISRTVLEWFEAIGVPLSEVYGMSESSGPITWDPHRNKPGFVGRAIPGCEVRIAADGEVCCRGGNVFQGYFKQPDKTAETLIDGWLHSGDIGELDHEGYLRIVDRKKELIITSGGKNVSPANLESALRAVPLIGSACAIGDGRKYVTALVTLDPDAAASWASQHDRQGASLAELALDPDVVAEVAKGVATVNRQFAQAERIKAFTIVGEEWSPSSDVMTPTSKLKRRGIVARYAVNIDAMYGDDEPPSEPPAEPPAEPPSDDEPKPEPPPAIPAISLAAPPVEFEHHEHQPEHQPEHEPEHDRYGWDPDGEPRSALRRWWWLVPLALLVAALGWLTANALADGGGSTSPPDSTAAPVPAVTVATTVATTSPTTLAPPPSTAAPATTALAVTTSVAPAERNTLLRRVRDSADLTIFLDAVEATDLQAELESDGPLTLFAPTDEAFAALPPDQLAALLADNTALLKVLRHHLVDGAVYVEDLLDGPLLARDGSTIEVEAVTDLLLDGTARLLDSDGTTINGVLHTVDTVLIPADLDLSALEPASTTTIASAVSTTISATTGPGIDFTIQFDAGSGVLNQAGKVLIAQVAEAIKALPKGSVVNVTGVTDTIGSASSNDYLAGLRANTVIGALKAAGATNVKYTLERLQEQASPADPGRSRRADIDLP